MLRTDTWNSQYCTGRSMDFLMKQLHLCMHMSKKYTGLTFGIHMQVWKRLTVAMEASEKAPSWRMKNK